MIFQLENHLDFLNPILAKEKKIITYCFTSQNIGNGLSFLISLPINWVVQNFMLTSLPVCGGLFINFPFTTRLGKRTARQGKPQSFKTRTNIHQTRANI